MLKARAVNHIFFGLSEMNMQRLREGMPIKTGLHELGIEVTVIIFYGETEEKMRDELLDLVGPDTVFKDSLRKDS